MIILRGQFYTGLCDGDSGSALWKLIRDENEPCISKGEEIEEETIYVVYPQEPCSSKGEPSKNPQPSTSKGQPSKRPCHVDQTNSNPKKPKYMEKYTVIAVSTSHNTPCGYKSSFATKIDDTVLKWINEHKEG